MSIRKKFAALAVAFAIGGLAGPAAAQHYSDRVPSHSSAILKPWPTAAPLTSGAVRHQFFRNRRGHSRSSHRRTHSSLIVSNRLAMRRCSNFGPAAKARAPHKGASRRRLLISDCLVNVCFRTVSRPRSE